MIRIHCTREEITDIFNMDVKTRNRILKDRGEGTFSLLCEKYQSEGKASLRRAQWKAVDKGVPTMLIWMGKQELGQRDKSDTKHEGHIGVTKIEEKFVYPTD